MAAAGDDHITARLFAALNFPFIRIVLAVGCFRRVLEFAEVGVSGPLRPGYDRDQHQPMFPAEARDQVTVFRVALQDPDFLLATFFFLLLFFLLSRDLA